MASDGQEPGQGELTPAQRSQMEQRQADQDRTLLAMRQLEAALAAAAPRREQAWRTEVRSALGVLAEAALEEQRNGEWRYLEFLQVTSSITAEMLLCEISDGTRARQRSRPVDLPEDRY
jgi:hypothetical protein